MPQVAAALGKDWLGYQTEPVRSIGFYCEDNERELIFRLDKIAAYYGSGLADLGNMAATSRDGEDNVLMEFPRNGRGELTPAWHALHEAAMDHHARLVNVDTAADTSGGNEISRTEVRQFVQVALSRLARDINGAVLLCAHPSIAGMATGRGDGGSTAWSNSVRSRLYLKTPDQEANDDDDDGQTDERILARKKANYGPKDSIRLRWSDHVLVRDGGGGIVGRIEQNANERWLLDAVVALVESGRDYSTANTQANYVPRMLAAQTDRPKGFGPKAIRAAYDALAFRDVIRVRDVKDPKKGRWKSRIVAVEERTFKVDGEA